MKISTHKSCNASVFAKKVVPVFLMFCITGCLQRPVIAPLPAPVKSDTSPVTSEAEVQPAIVAEPGAVQDGPGAPLFRKAQNYIQENKYKQAELVLERALRFEPKNGYYWYSLAQAKYGQKQYGKTVQLCLKSKSLAGDDRELIRLNDQLMEKSQ